MEFMEGCKVNDLKAIQKMGLDPKEVFFFFLFFF